MNLNYSNANIITDLSKLSTGSACDLLSVNYHNNKPVIIDFIKSFKDTLSNFSQDQSISNLATLQYLSSNLDSLVTPGDAGMDVQGIQGIKGISGDSLLGARGDQGSQGVQGISGLDSFEGIGDQGIQGLQGIQGPDQIVNKLKGPISYYITDSIGRKGIIGETNNLSTLQGTSGFRTILDMTKLESSENNSYKLTNSLAKPVIMNNCVLVTNFALSTDNSLSKTDYATLKKNVLSKFSITGNLDNYQVYYQYNRSISGGEEYLASTDMIVKENLTRFYVAPTGLEKFKYDHDVATNLEANRMLRGPRGYTVVGLQGVQGIQGIMGPKGDDVEIKGEVGDKGQIGLVGPQGDPGLDGTNGISYFHNNELSESEVMQINQILNDYFGVSFSEDSNGNLVITARDVIGVPNQ